MAFEASNPNLVFKKARFRNNSSITEMFCGKRYTFVIFRDGEGQELSDVEKWINRLQLEEFQTFGHNDKPLHQDSLVIKL